MTLMISKLDAARRQLEVAVRLYFFNDDPVSIYTLGAAAYGILRDILIARDLPLQTMEQQMMTRAVPGKERELMFALRRHQNFFKHADRDPDAAIDFNPESTEWILLDASLAYTQLTTETTPLMRTFYLWWQFSYRDLIKEEYSEMRETFEKNADIFKNGRQSFFSKMLPLLQMQHI